MMADYFQNPKEKITLEEIEFTMWQRAREIWNAADVPKEAFDPLVKLLIGACAVEIKKIHDEIESSKSRVLQNLAHLLMPDVLTGPVPASAIVATQSNDSMYTISPKLQVTGNKADTELFFSPSGFFQITDSKIERCLLLLGDRLADITGHTDPQNRIAQPTILSSKKDASLGSDKRALFIGLNLHETINSLDSLLFFIDWLNLPEKQKGKYFQSLPSFYWFINGKPCTTRVGIQSMKPESRSAGNEYIEDAYCLDRLLENHVNNLYQKHFITIQNLHEIRKIKHSCPEELKPFFQESDVSTLAPLLWLEVQFPAIYPDDVLLNQLVIYNNCFPVMNRKLNAIRHALYGKNMNVVPLKTEDTFLSIHQVQDNTGNSYSHQFDFRQAREQAGSYYLRWGSAGRFDTRDAAQFLDQLHDLLHDEATLYTGMDPDGFASDMRTLQQILNRMTKTMERFGPQNEPYHYLFLNPKQRGSTAWEEIVIHFWSTTGSFANDIPQGEIRRIASVDDSAALRSVTNVTPVLFGRDRLKDTALLNAYRSALCTRGRVVTAEDIKAVCTAHLGSHLSGIEIRDGIMIDDNDRHGFIKTTDVLLVPSKTASFDEHTWDRLCHELKTVLQNQWVGGRPLRVQLIKMDLDEKNH